MRAATLVASLVLVSAQSAFAQEPPADAAPEEPASPPVDPNAEAPQPVEPPPPPPAEPPPPPPPPPPAEPPPPAPAHTTTVTSSSPPPRTEEPSRVDDYYSRQRGMGIFHHGHLAVSVWSGDAPITTMEPGTGTATTELGGKTIGSLVFEGSWLGMPSSFGNFHGIEGAIGLRTAPWDFFMQMGTGVTLFNLGRGGPGSFRIGGGFGFGFNFAHGYGYVRARAAVVIIPAKLDVEASVQWTPTSASTGYYDELQQRASLWYRPGKSSTAYEVYVEKITREDTSAMLEREFDGIGIGVGVAK